MKSKRARKPPVKRRPVVSASHPERCPERKDGGPHSFTADIEYDITGQTINCEYCGEPAPEKET